MDPLAIRPLSAGGATAPSLRATMRAARQASLLLLLLFYHYCYYFIINDARRAAGSRYEGEFVDDQRHGYGVYDYLNGDRSDAAI